MKIYYIFYWYMLLHNLFFLINPITHTICYSFTLGFILVILLFVLFRMFMVSSCCSPFLYLCKYVLSFIPCYPIDYPLFYLFSLVMFMFNSFIYKISIQFCHPIPFNLCSFFCLWFHFLIDKFCLLLF